MSASDELKQQAIASYNDGRVDDAISQWQAALGHSPEDWELMVYLGSAHKEQGQLEIAADYYQSALEREPRLAEVHYNLGNIRQSQNRLPDAMQCYGRALELKPDFAFAYYNLGNVFRDLGQLDKAGECFQQAILNAPDHAPSYNNLGNILKHLGQLDQARQCYQAALDVQPDYDEAKYNLGNAWFEAEEFAAALPWFEASSVRDAEARALYCYYKCQRFEEFAQKLTDHCRRADHRSPQVATLAAHHAINFGTDNPYRFCPQPFDMVYHESVPELAPGSALQAAILAALDEADIEERVQGRLHHGVQSAGNLFQRGEPALQELAELVRRHLRHYQERHAEADCELISSFPGVLDFESAWYIRMQRGGHLDAHIHEGGWISGVLYLSLPQVTANSDAGRLELGLHGDDYPLQVAADAFPSQTVPIGVGDIVLFPANLFHRTLPFETDEERLCIAFDLRPAAGVR